MQSLRTFADNSQPASLANRLRRKRHEFFLDLLSRIPGKVRLLDVGGTQSFWQMMGEEIPQKLEITLLNLEAEPVSMPQVNSIAGDGCNLCGFADGEFDVVFSNSVIEHVPTTELQQQMAAEIRRVGKRYFVQTPNRYFPIEPHFLCPGYQFLPRDLKALLNRKFALGWYPRAKDKAESYRMADSIRLLTARELRNLFPEASIYREKLAGLTKSLIAHGCW